MLRRLFTTVVVTLAVLAVAGPALAAPPQTETITRKNVVQTFRDVIPSCEPPTAPTHRITTTTHVVEHSTLFDDGRLHVSFLQTGTFVARPLHGGPTLTGSFTSRGGFNDNGKVVNGTFVFTVRGTDPGGSRFVTHTVDHFNTTPTGAEFFFSHCHD